MTDSGTDGEICLTAWEADNDLLGEALLPHHEGPVSFDQTDHSPVTRDYPEAIEIRLPVLSKNWRDSVIRGVSLSIINGSLSAFCE